MNLLFVCRHNAGRSQIAAGYAYQIGGHKIRSAGIRVNERHGHPIPEDVVKVMKEDGVDIMGSLRHQLSKEHIDWADIVVTMAEPSESSLLDSDKVVYWDVPDPQGLTYQILRSARDDIHGRIIGLLRELDEQNK